MSYPKRIALDVDDVIAAFTPHAHAFYGKKVTEKIDYWSVDLMDEILGKGWFHDRIAGNEEFWNTLPVLSPAQDIDFDVACYISSFPPKMYHLRQEWLKRHKFPNAPLILERDKLWACNKLGIDILIDDKPETMCSLRGSGVRGIHFITPYAGFEPVGQHIINLKQVKYYL